jgi:hypothetical protein
MPTTSPASPTMSATTNDMSPAPDPRSRTRMPSRRPAASISACVGAASALPWTFRRSSSSASWPSAYRVFDTQPPFSTNRLLHAGPQGSHEVPTPARPHRPLTDQLLVVDRPLRRPPGPCRRNVWQTFGTPRPRRSPALARTDAPYAHRVLNSRGQGFRESPLLLRLRTVVGTSTRVLRARASTARRAHDRRRRRAGGRGTAASPGPPRSRR